MRRAIGGRPDVAVGALTGAFLLAVYSLTLAPDVTLWDAGELIAAVHTLGIPHPPGNPLFVLVGRVWTTILAPLGVAQAANLMSAVATALAGALLSAQVVSWLGSRAAGLAGGIGAGVMATVWSNATETEVYALALLLAVATLVAADRAGRRDDERWTVLVAYLMALAVPLHIFTLVAAPAAVLLASVGSNGAVRLWRGMALCIVFLATAGMGTVRPWLLAVAAVATCGWLVLASRRRPSRSYEVASRETVAAVNPALLPTLLAAAALGVSIVLVMLIRARMDPLLDQGDPSTWRALLDVLGRRQYDVAPLWPRQAPLWLQLGNILEYADWQVALSLAPGPRPAWGRTTITVIYAVLGVLGCIEHRRRDLRSWRALVLFMATASVGVVLYLNLRAGPSFGHGVLPDGAPREARERAYFFVFAFWLWGCWSGIGAVSLARRLYGTLPRAASGVIAVTIAALPIALNWTAVDRRHGADVSLALTVGRALLDASPPGAVLLTAGDLDSYPVWYLQAVHGERPDVTVVVAPLLPAGWYRAQLARRHALADEGGGQWAGAGGAVREVADHARTLGRPLVASALLPVHEREEASSGWVAAGVIHVRVNGAPAQAVDTVTALRTIALVGPDQGDIRLTERSADPAARLVRRLLACAPAALMRARDPVAHPPSGLLATMCNWP